MYQLKLRAIFLVVQGTEELDCELSLRTLKIQISKVWFIAHTVGWFAKV